MKKSVLKKYATLVAEVGVNVQPGQDVIINAELDQTEFVTYVVEACYKRGARTVTVDWTNPPKIRIMDVKYQSEEQLATLEKWREEKLKHYTETIPCRIHILSATPDSLKGMDQKKLAKARRALYPLTKKYNDLLENKYQWTIVGVPSVDWAKKVFPNETKSKAVEKLWEAILTTARVTDDPVEEWKRHNKELLDRCNYLNNLDIDYLEYKANNGTDFKVWLNKEGIFVGGGETSLQGIYYNPNMPTEECFTTPIRGRAEGHVVASLPLSYQGNLIEDFAFDFKDGRVVKCYAKKGLELLEEMVSMDEGASMLGEVALVPFESPVNQTNVLFYNTLYDENAVCHFALGRGFNECIKDFTKYNSEEIKKMGVNESMIHVDFMIGTKDLSITATLRDGSKIAIFKEGTWAFDIK